LIWPESAGDIVLIELDGKAPKGAGEFKLNRLLKNQLVGQMGYSLGYGYSQKTITASGKAIVTGETSLKGVANPMIEGGFDGTIKVDMTSTDQGTCVGDSGGPYFTYDKDSVLLYGLTQSQDVPVGSVDRCHHNGLVVDISLWADWLDNRMKMSDQNRQASR
jgi:hypothetical protein